MAEVISFSGGSGLEASYVKSNPRFVLFTIEGNGAFMSPFNILLFPEKEACKEWRGEKVS